MYCAVSCVVCIELCCVISSQNAEDLLKVVRRLELRALEQQCWKHLMSAVSAHNCRELHELADRFDCPPLKLTSWHMLQEMRVGYGAHPSSRLLHTHAGGGGAEGGGGMQLPAVPFGLKGSGLVGPGESDIVFGADAGNASDDDEYLSVFNDYTEEFRAARGEDSTSYSEEQEQLFPLPEQLPPGAPASDVIKAWAYKLQLVYDMCVPRDGLDQYGGGGGGGGGGNGASEGGYGYGGGYLDEHGYGSGNGNGNGNDHENHHAHHPHQKRGEDNSFWSPENDPNYQTIKRNLIDYYTERSLTDKIASVDNILTNFKGRDDMIYEALRNKYDDPQSADYIHPRKHIKKNVLGKQSSKGFLGGLFS
jgi:hypothetical protein